MKLSAPNTKNILRYAYTNLRKHAYKNAPAYSNTYASNEIPKYELAVHTFGWDPMVPPPDLPLLQRG